MKGKWWSKAVLGQDRWKRRKLRKHEKNSRGQKRFSQGLISPRVGWKKWTFPKLRCWGFPGPFVIFSRSVLLSQGLCYEGAGLKPRPQTHDNEEVVVFTPNLLKDAHFELVKLNHDSSKHIFLQNENARADPFVTAYETRVFTYETAS